MAGAPEAARLEDFGRYDSPCAKLAPKTRGGIRWDKPKKTAVIWVLDPADYHEAAPGARGRSPQKLMKTDDPLIDHIHEEYS